MQVFVLALVCYSIVDVIDYEVLAIMCYSIVIVGVIDYEVLP